MSKAFDKIAEGLSEALSIARGEAAPFKVHTPQEIDVRAIREHVSMTQESFAAAFGFSLSQIKDWEEGGTPPQGGVRAYLQIIRNAPDEVLSLLKANAA